MEHIYLINTDKKEFEKVPFNKKESYKIISDIYFLRYRVPTQTEIDKAKAVVKKYYQEHTLELVKKAISNTSDNIPLFNIYHVNIYLIKKENVYYRVVYGDYR